MNFMPHSIPTEASLGTGKQMIILIHDLWLKPESLELFKNFYYECGYEVLSPAWPRMENFHGLRENAHLLDGLGLARSRRLRAYLGPAADRQGSGGRKNRHPNAGRF
jgi:hypothetical protein